MEQFHRSRIVLVTDWATVPLKVSGVLGEISLNTPVYGSILDLLADHKPHSIGEIEQSLRSSGILLNQIMQAVMVLAGQGTVFPVQDESASAKARAQTDKLNAHIKAQAPGSNDVSYLASPVIGGGVAVNRFQQLFLLAAENGRKQPAEWAAFAWQFLDAQDQQLVKDGRPIESDEGNLAELTAQAKTFGDKQLPILKALEVA